MRAQAYWEQGDCARFAYHDLASSLCTAMILIIKIFSVLGLILISVPALAQTTFSLSVETDHRYRGRSLSDGRPVVAIAASHDIKDGIYTGVNALATLTGKDRAGPLTAQLYVGIARNLNKDVSVDVGISGYHYTKRSSLNQNAEYFEVYAGLTRGQVSGYLRYSPNHLGTGTPVVYLDVNANAELAPEWTLVGHIGILTQSVGGPPRLGGRRVRYDTRLGITRTFGRFEVNSAVTFAGPNDEFFAGPWHGRSAFTLSATRHF